MAFQRKKPAAHGVKAPFPGFVEPALATSTDKVPSGDRWMHDIKFDGAVSAINYQGPTGGLIIAGEQCAYAVDACVKPRS